MFQNKRKVLVISSILVGWVLVYGGSRLKKEHAYRFFRPEVPNPSILPKQQERVEVSQKSEDKILGVEFEYPQGISSLKVEDIVQGSGVGHTISKTNTIYKNIETYVKEYVNTYTEKDKSEKQQVVEDNELDKSSIEINGDVKVYIFDKGAIYEITTDEVTQEGMVYKIAAKEVNKIGFKEELERILADFVAGFKGN